MHIGSRFDRDIANMSGQRRQINELVTVIGRLSRHRFRFQQCARVADIHIQKPDQVDLFVGAQEPGRVRFVDGVRLFVDSPQPRAGRDLVALRRFLFANQARRTDPNLGIRA